MQSWMRQLGLGSQRRPASSSQQQPAVTKAIAAAALAAAKSAASATAAQQYGTVVVTEQRRFAGQTITVNKEVAKDSKEAKKAEEAAAGEEGAAARNKAGLDAVLGSLAQAKKVRWGALAVEPSRRVAVHGGPGVRQRTGSSRQWSPVPLLGAILPLQAPEEAPNTPLPPLPPGTPPQAPLPASLPFHATAQVTVLDKSRSDWKDYKKSDEGVDEELEMHKRSGAQFLDKQAFLKQAELREYEIERDRRLASDVRNRGRL